MGMTILNQRLKDVGATEQLVNAVIELAKEQGIAPDTEVDVDHPLSLGTVHFEGLHTHTEPAADPEVVHTHKPEGPKPN